MYNAPNDPTLRYAVTRDTTIFPGYPSGALWTLVGPTTCWLVSDYPPLELRTWALVPAGDPGVVWDITAPSGTFQMPLRLEYR